MNDVSVALLAVAATLIVGLMGTVVTLLRRNNKNHNPGKEMWSKLWSEHENLESEIKTTRQVVRDGFADLGRKMDDNRKEIVAAIGQIGK